MSFKIQILGSGSAVPTLRRNPTSQYIVTRNRHILIDCAEGTQMQMRKYGVKFQRIDIILISHLHGDHYFGLMGLMSTMHLLGRVKSLVIFGPEGLKEIIDTHMNHSQSQFGYDFLVHEIKPNTIETLFDDQKINIRCFPLKHKIPTHGFVITQKQKEPKLDKEKADRDNVKIEYYHLLKKGLDVETESGEILRSSKYTIESPKAISYAYCSDTAYEENILPHIRNVKMLYHEATFTDSHVRRAHITKHSTAKEAALIAKQAGVEKLLLGHISARFDTGEDHLIEAKEVFSACELAEDGDEYML